jgi:hypothetical protein
MNCCDYNCTQGRDCPVRKEPTCPHCRGLGYDASGYPCTCQPADVARIGKKMRAADPLPASPWRRQLRELAKFVLGCILVSVLVSAALVTTTVTFVGLVNADAKARKL